MAKTLMPLASTKVLVGACDNWANYTCGWGDPLGTASIDFAVQQSSMVINLSPDTSKHPAQAAMFAVFAAHMGPLGAFSGWAEPESDMVALLSKKDGVVVCGVRGAPRGALPCPRHAAALVCSQRTFQPSPSPPPVSCMPRKMADMALTNTQLVY